MKRSVSILFLWLYTALIIGIDVSVEYSGHEVSSVVLSFARGEKASQDDSEEKEEYRKYHDYAFELKSNHGKIQHTLTLNLLYLQPVIPVYEYDYRPVTTVIFHHHHHVPAERLKEPLYIIHRVLRI